MYRQKVAYNEACQSWRLPEATLLNLDSKFSRIAFRVAVKAQPFKNCKQMKSVDWIRLCSSGALQYLLRDAFRGKKSQRKVIVAVGVMVRFLTKKSWKMSDREKEMKEIFALRLTITNGIPRHCHTLLLHLTVHLAEQGYIWSSSPSMYVFERGNLIIQLMCTSKRFPEASIGNNFTLQHDSKSSSRFCKNLPGILQEPTGFCKKHVSSTASR